MVGRSSGRQRFGLSCHVDVVLRVKPVWFEGLLGLDCIGAFASYRNNRHSIWNDIALPVELAGNAVTVLAAALRYASDDSCARRCVRNAHSVSLDR